VQSKSQSGKIKKTTKIQAIMDKSDTCATEQHIEA